ncbi:BspA family leucine-rich repeat surface protein [Rhodobacterales bacterium LSUCC0387]|nr:BspA family leucine-rich repeat surface protein [Rhodobacterales bacterium LSUCC0387]
MRFIGLFLLSLVFAAQFSIPAMAQTPLTDATFSTAITNCLAEQPVTGLCTSYGASSGFGTMPNWDTSQVTDMDSAFKDRTTFNGDISAWNVSSVTNFYLMFYKARAFNADIGSWDVSSGTYFKAMFYNANVFNADIGRWDVSNNTDFFWMFWQATSFNQDISAWDVTSATSLGQMFRDAPDFSQDIRGWDVSNIPDGADWNLFSGSATAMQAAYPLNINTKAWFVSGTPIREFIAPTLTFSPADGATGVAADANITITFNEAVRLLDDSALSDTNVDALITLKDTNSSGSNIAFDATVSGNVITINPTGDFSSEQTVYVAIGATVEDSSDNAITASSATFTVVQTNSPALDFAANETAIRTVLVDDMMRAVRSSLNASARMMSDVRGRLRGADGSLPTLSTRSAPLEIDGVASADAGTLSTRGTATASLIRHSGAYRRLFFSDFDIQHDLDTDNTTATLSARVAWEHMVADGTLLGYYVGAEASESDINGTFAGDQTRLGLNVGGYIAHRLAETLFTDAYLSLGVGHSELDMSNGTLALESDYRSETVTVGASVSGSYDYTDYEFRPELAVNYGKTQIGTVFFTGRAYGLVDDTLSLNAGSVSIANVTLRPEVIYAIQNSPTANTNASLSFSPRLICERTMATRRTENCGSGGEVGYTAHSNDGLRNIDFRFAVDKVGSSRRSSAVFGVEMRF